MVDANICPICSSESFLLDVVDFSINYPYFWNPDKSVSDCHLSSLPIYYSHCKSCQFTYAPEIANWSSEKLEKEIYNEKFTLMDVDAVERRPTNNARSLFNIFPDNAQIKHLDFGGGTGYLSKLLSDGGWDSISFDPYLNTSVLNDDLKKYNLITSYEVFEHATNPNTLMDQICDLLDENGIIIFSTQVSDGIIAPGRRLDWWYVTPSTGHISLYSRKSLVLLGEKYQFKFISFNNGYHCFFKEVPLFAKLLIDSYTR